MGYRCLGLASFGAGGPGVVSAKAYRLVRSRLMVGGIRRSWSGHLATVARAPPWRSAFGKTRRVFRKVCCVVGIQIASGPGCGDGGATSYMWHTIAGMSRLVLRELRGLRGSTYVYTTESTRSTKTDRRPGWLPGHLPRPPPTEKQAFVLSKQDSPRELSALDRMEATGCPGFLLNHPSAGSCASIHFLKTVYRHVPAFSINGQFVIAPSGVRRPELAVLQSSSISISFSIII